MIQRLGRSKVDSPPSLLFFRLNNLNYLKKMCFLSFFSYLDFLAVNTIVNVFLRSWLIELDADPPGTA